MNIRKNIVNLKQKVIGSLLICSLIFSFTPGSVIFAQESDCNHTNITDVFATKSEGTYHIKKCDSCNTIIEEHQINKNCSYCAKQLTNSAEEETKQCKHEYEDILIGDKDGEYTHLQICNICKDEQLKHENYSKDACSLCDKYFSKEYEGLKKKLEKNNDGKIVVTTEDIDEYQTSTSPAIFFSTVALLALLFLEEMRRIKHKK